MVSSRPLSVVRSIVSLVGVAAPAPSCTVPVGGTPASALRSAGAPPVLSVSARRSASACAVFRSITMVIGALAVAAAADLTAAVAVNVSVWAWASEHDHG